MLMVWHLWALLYLMPSAHSDVLVNVRFLWLSQQWPWFLLESHLYKINMDAGRNKTDNNFSLLQLDAFMFICQSMTNDISTEFQ